MLIREVNKMNGCMSSFPGMPSGEVSPGIAQLKAEHVSLREKLAGLFSLSEKIENGIDPEQAFSQLKKEVVVFKEELDPHSEREESVLFPMLGAYIGTTTGPIAVMEYEHEQAKSFIKTFLAGAESEPISPEKVKDLAELIKNAHHILTDHFTKEENVLFMMAERMLSDEEKEEMHRRIQEI
jgi:hemerythrin-like domain-containing protein